MAVKSSGSPDTVSETEVLRLRAASALSVVPLISRVVPGYVDRAVVVADVVTQWLALTETVRDRYRHSDRSVTGGMEPFASDYVDQVERAVQEAPDNGQAITFEAIEQVMVTCWHRHVQRLKAGPMRFAS